jgi:Na+/phosphate symporter
MIILFPFLLTLAGFMLYIAASKAELKECGRISFFVGLLVLTLQVAHQTFSFLR